MEVFKTIEGFEDYEVSNLGSVKSLKHGKEKILKPCKDGCGYVHVRLYPREPIFGFYKNGDMRPKLEKIHRLVALTFLTKPDIPTYQEINHLDGDKINNDVTNLEWISRKENMRHGWRTGLMDNGKVDGGIKRRKPVRVTYLDGRVEYYSSRNHCAANTNTSIASILNKMKSDNYGRKGFIVRDIKELPEGESFTTSEELEKLVVSNRIIWRGYLDEYYSNKITKKKVVE
tara:strand:+ start:147 stop:836 length:690 start_codon:yes stop_codon:yes gene_type:complete